MLSLSIVISLQHCSITGLDLKSSMKSSDLLRSHLTWDVMCVFLEFSWGLRIQGFVLFFFEGWVGLHSSRLAPTKKLKRSQTVWSPGSSFKSCIWRRNSSEVWLRVRMLHKCCLQMELVSLSLQHGKWCTWNAWHSSGSDVVVKNTAARQLHLEATEVNVKNLAS